MVQSVRLEAVLGTGTYRDGRYTPLHGRVLARQLTRCHCLRKQSGSMTARVLSEGIRKIVGTPFGTGTAEKEEEGTTAALIRGVAGTMKWVIRRRI